MEQEILNFRDVVEKQFDTFIRENKDEIVEMLVSDVVKEIKNNKSIRDIVVNAILEHDN